MNYSVHVWLVETTSLFSGKVVLFSHFLKITFYLFISSLRMLLQQTCVFYMIQTF